MEWRLLDALFLALRNFANSNLAKEKATVDAHGYVLCKPFLCPCIMLRTKGWYIHIGVGFGVARSGKMGNAKASKSGTGKQYGLPRSFYIYATKVLRHKDLF